MSWFRTSPVAKITTSDKYYFITSEIRQNGFFRIHYPENIQITNDMIKKLECGVDMIAIPCEMIDTLNPSKDFTIKVEITKNNNFYCFKWMPLKEVLTNNTLKSTEYLTHAILSAGEPCLDLEKNFCCFSQFTCDKIY